MYGFHAWHISGDTVRSSLRRTYTGRLHPGTSVPSRTAQKHETHRAYLEEDVELIRKYFPGAKTVALHTPFDLTVAPEDPWKLRADDCDGPIIIGYCGDLLWDQ